LLFCVGGDDDNDDDDDDDDDDERLRFEEVSGIFYQVFIYCSRKRFLIQKKGEKNEGKKTRNKKDIYIVYKHK
jgi:hypothetical protein